MAEVMTEIVKRMHPAIINIAGVLIVLGIGYVAYTWSRVSRQFLEVVGREDKILHIAQQLYEEKTKRAGFEDMALQLQAAVDRLAVCMEEVEGLRSKLRSRRYNRPEEFVAESLRLVQRILESLASLLKTRTEDHHRCGLWLLVPSNELLLVAATSGFPSSYPFSRRLGLHNSVAGRAFRKNTEEIIPDIRRDPDYSENPESKHDYRSLLCFPIGTLGVVTIDGKRPFDPAQISVARLYVRLISALIVEFTGLDREWEWEW